MNKIGLTGVAIVMAGLSALAAERRPMALLIMLDGVRADAIANASTPNIDRLMAGKWRPGYTCAWSLAGQTVRDAPPDSAPNHSSIATGVCAAKHGVKRTANMKNGRFAEWPIWLQRVAEADPSRRALYVYSWKPDELCSSDPRVRKIHGTDEDNARTLPKILAGKDAPDATLYYVDLPDHCGHMTSFYPSTATYLNGVKTSDQYVGAVLGAIASRTTFDEEDWLIMITADHGGYQYFHGMPGGSCTTIPVVLAGRHVPTGELKGRPFHYDLTATALKHFGLDAKALDLDGRVLTEVAQARPARSLSDQLKVYLPFDGEKPVNLIEGDIVPELFGVTAKCGVKPGYGVESGIVGGGFHLGGGGGSGLLLKGSERLEFENGGDFTIAVWVRIPGPIVDAPIVSNKDWTSGDNPGICLSANGKVDLTGPGVCFNAAVGDSRKRVDMGALVGDQAQWTFYAVTRRADGVLTLCQGAPDGRFYWVCDEARDLNIKALPFRLGQDGAGAFRITHHAEIDEFALWTRSLDRNEVKGVFDAVRQGREILREAVADGGADMVAEWEGGKRAETLRWFAENQFGVTPIGRPADEQIGERSVTFANGQITINIHLSLPEGADAQHPVPVFVYGDHVCKNHSLPYVPGVHDGMPTNTITGRGYAYVSWNFNDICPNAYLIAGDLQNWAYGVIAWQKTGKLGGRVERTPSSWGTIGAWAWGFSRVMDWIETRPELDAKRVAILGHSRGGKTALWAAAQDERIAMAISNGSGCGGAKLNAFDCPDSEHIGQILWHFPNWFCPNYAHWIGRDEEITHDADDLLRRIAPRICYVASGSEDVWAGPAAEKEAWNRAHDLWQAYGCPEKMGYHCHPGPHRISAEDWAHFLDFTDKVWFKGKR